MNINQFRETYKDFTQKQKIKINCNVCQKEHCINREKAEQNILKHGFYIDRSCSMKMHHQKSPRGDDTKEKQRQGRLGKTQSSESKKKMSESKKEFYKTTEGKSLKRKLSYLTAQKHSLNKFENTKRQGWYPSEKTGKWMYYGSSYELRLCWLLDQDDYIKTYETQIGYEGQNNSRCLDFLVTDIYDIKRAIEVKPESRLNEQYNIEQIADSRIHAEKMGWSFEVYTEINLEMTAREIRTWADDYRKTITGIDYAEHRMEIDRQKGLRHYHKHIATDKVDVWCDYCKETHSPLRLTYDKNIKRNGKYICEKHGGFIAGSKPKKKKENPYASEGKKQCTECTEIKLLGEFGSDKSREDGYANRCKICRAKAATKKYQEGKKLS